MALAGLSKQTAKVGAGRGSRTPKTRRSADFESLSTRNQVLHFVLLTMT
jgi:hypothetical protein